MTESTTSDARSRPTRTEILSIVVACGCLAVAVLFQPPSGLSRSGLIALGIFGFGLVLWQSEAVPHVVTSLLVVGFLYAFGTVSTFEAAATGFASTLFFFFFALLVLGHAISKVGLDARVARRLLASASTPRASFRQTSRYVLALSFLMPSALARMVAFTPIIEEVADIYDLDADHPFRTSSFLLLGQLNPIASMSLMTGGGLPIIGAQLIQTSGYTINWITWALYMIPPAVFIYVVGVISLEWLHPIASDSGRRTTDGDGRAGTDKDGRPETDGDGAVDDPEPITRDQWAVGLVMGATLLSWAASPFLGIPTVLPAIVAVGVLSLPAVGVLDVEDMTEVSWGVLFLIGGMFSLIDVLEATGAFEWLVAVGSAVIPFGAFAPATIVIVLLALVLGIRLLFPSGSACLIVVVPILVTFARTYDLNGLFLSLSAVVVAGSTVLVPLHVPPALLAFNRGHVDTREVFALGVVTILAAIVAIAGAWLVYWPLVEAVL
ncbi:Di-and tricarboxylate transporter [Halopenitus malekzadehii]|uniref:Di-and tricarboxylate transporter n=1 Tax=Halopenitus malekzadehii TaxID=1267564 RepID=A0A1H6J3R5_9EURY|nr:SLC13 family permease [Halopenitus malekzadehii]SEH54871.1 Di-and tricarboxylate transporter [Halopenitus malekzadehii]